MKRNEYKIVPLIYKGKLSGLVDIPNTEASINKLGAAGWRYQRIYNNPSMPGYMYFYFEREIDDEQELDLVKYEYQLFNVEFVSKLSSTLSPEKNEVFLTGMGMERWRLVDIVYYMYAYHILERRLIEEN